jgi:hypothetical protein
MKVLLLLALWAWSGPAVTRIKLPVAPLTTGGKQILLLGESHQMLGGVKAITSSLPDLKAAGVNVIGIEGLKLPDQASVDAYVSGETAQLPEQALLFSPARKDVFRELFEKAKQTGTRLLAMGLPHEHWGAEVAELAAQKTGDPAESFGDSLPGQVERAGRTYEHGFNQAVAEVALTKRNQYMAARLKREVGPSGKAVILLGHSHISRPPPLDYQHLWMDVARYGTLHSELLRLGLLPYSLTLLGGPFITPQDAAEHQKLLAAAYGLPDLDLGPEAGLHLLNSPSAAQNYVK